MKKILFILSITMFIASCDDLCDCEENNNESPELTCNDIYPGFWKATCDCAITSQNSYTITVNESDDCIETTFYNFLGEGEIIDIEFKTQSIIIPQQEFDDHDDIFGTGFLRNDTLRITFTLQDRTFGWEDICELIAVKE